MKMIDFPCPFCGNKVEVTKEFYDETDKICCMHCNKAFAITKMKGPSPQNYSDFNDKVIEYFNTGGNTDDEPDDWF